MSLDRNPMEYYAFDGMFFNYDAYELSEHRANNLSEKTRRDQKEVEDHVKAYLDHMTSVIEIRKSVLSDLLKSRETYMVRRYARKEGLPYIFVETARKREGLYILIKEFVSRVMRVAIDDATQANIKAIVRSTYGNTEDIVYHRVGDVRRFISPSQG